MVSRRVAAAAGVVVVLVVACCAQQARANADLVQPSDKKKKAPPPPIKCNNAQKEEILHECELWVKKNPPYTFPIDRCCDAVMNVPLLDMACIVRLLTSEEKERYNERQIMRLEWMCNPSPAGKLN
uniref:Bifunctional inhibitor/plant lipid transfer protein/seed storage helical domain-containing protein n=1 Tax=Leersia perrieri TaxID=77586 RepID=A0A0D9XXV4_9ORYZ